MRRAKATLLLQNVAKALKQPHEKAEAILKNISETDASGLVSPEQWLGAMPAKARALLEQYAAAH